MKRNYKLTNRELEVMQVLWDSDQPLAATDIPERNSSLNLSTVQVALRKLMEKSYIKVADIVYHNTVLTRVYEPVLTQEDYMIDYLKASSLNAESIVASLVKKENSMEVLEKLETFIQKRKKLLKDKKSDV